MRSEVRQSQSLPWNDHRIAAKRSRLWLGLCFALGWALLLVALGGIAALAERPLHLPVSETTEDSFGMPQKLQNQEPAWTS